MSDFVNKIKDKASSVYNDLTKRTVFCYVLSSDDKNNTVSVRYINRLGMTSNKDNVTVRIYGDGTEWFPSKGEIVIAEESQNNMTVIARGISHYASEIRAKMTLVADTLEDTKSVISGYIFG